MRAIPPSLSGDGEHRFGKPAVSPFPPSQHGQDTDVAGAQTSCNVALICLGRAVDTLARKGFMRRQSVGRCGNRSSDDRWLPYAVEVASPAALPKAAIVKLDIESGEAAAGRSRAHRDRAGARRFPKPTRPHRDPGVASAVPATSLVQPRRECARNGR